MKKFSFLVLMLLSISAFGQQLIGQPDGWANVGTPVTGGEGGTVVTPKTSAELKTYMGSANKYIILIDGEFDLGGSMTPCFPNKTLLGVANRGKIKNGGLEFHTKTNVIIQNIEFTFCSDDLIKLFKSQHIWVDHCTFSDGPTMDVTTDGLFDISMQSDFVTISYCVFFNHSKNILIGAKDGQADDAGKLNVTIHHNWFKGTEQRNPRVRYGHVHCYNNYYSDNSIYGLCAAMNSYVTVEGCYFKNVKYPMYIGYYDSPAGYLNQSNNIFDNSGTAPSYNGEYGKDGKTSDNTPKTNPHTWEPSSVYSYSLMNASEVPAYVMANAGAGKIPTAIWNQYQNAGKIDFYGNTISFDVKGETTVSLIDANGRFVQSIFNGFSVTSSPNQIELNSSLPNGVYFIIMKSEDGESTKKIIIKP